MIFIETSIFSKTIQTLLTDTDQRLALLVKVAKEEFGNG